MKPPLINFENLKKKKKKRKKKEKKDFVNIKYFVITLE
jgi:hypothetical protein